MKLQILSVFALAAGTLYAAPELEFSGRLAQSQPETFPPVKEVSPGGIANEPGSSLPVVIFGTTFFRIKQDGSLENAGSTRFSGGGIHSDGKELLKISNMTIERYRLEDGEWKRIRCIYKTEQPLKDITYTHSSTRKGFAAKGKFFGLNRKNREIYAWDENGKELGTVLTLPEIPNRKTRWECIGILPESGDLIAASYYPDYTLYRFRTDGSEFKKDGWPVRGTMANHITIVNGTAAGLFSGAKLYPEKMESKKEIAVISDGNDIYSNGIASDGSGGYWISTSTGLKHYHSSDFREADRRIGGTGKIKALTLNGNRVIFSTGGNLYGLMIDDAPDSPFFSTGNEPWRCGGDWSSSADFICSLGKKLLVGDAKQKKFWIFDPSGKTNMERWKTFPGNGTEPTAVASADDSLFVAENGNFNGLSGVTVLTAADGKNVAAANSNGVFWFRNGKLLWKKDISNVKSLAAMQNRYLVASTGTKLILLDSSDGKMLSETPSKVTLVSSEGKWLVGFSPEEYAVLRYKLK